MRRMEGEKEVKKRQMVNTCGKREKREGRGEKWRNWG